MRSGGTLEDTSNSTAAVRDIDNKVTSPNGSSSTTNGHTEMVASARPTGSFFGHDREQVTRILIQGLSDLGYCGAAAKLSEESRYKLEDTTVAAFRDAVLQGDWAKAELLLIGREIDNTERVSENDPGGLPLAEGCSKNDLLFRMRRQKFLELLEQDHVREALHVLQQELAPLKENAKRLHMLSRYAYKNTSIRSH